MRIDETRQDRVVTEVHDLGTTSLQTEDISLASRRNNATVSYGDSLDDCIGCIHRMDAPCKKDGFGRARFGCACIPGTRCSHCCSDETRTDTAKDIAPTLQASHDLHETRITGIAHLKAPLSAARNRTDRMVTEPAGTSMRKDDERPDSCA